MRIRPLVTISIFTLLAATCAYAQQQSLEAEIPFQFSIGKTTYPAGTYKFSLINEPLRLVMSSGKESSNLMVLTRLGGPSAVRDASLAFDSSEGQQILSEVWMPGAGGLLLHTTPKDHAHQIVLAGAAGSAKLSGKAAYEQTCRRCHGPEGKGDADADKFFKTTIPRLNSEAVQKKSNEEIKAIVTQGKRQMDPVRIGEPGMKHLLSLQSVDAVIAYLRTFKQQ